MRYISIILFLILFATMQACITTGRGRDGEVHVVEKGETLWSLSRQYDVSVEDIMQANNLSSANSIRVGQILVIPNASGIPRKAISRPSSQPRIVDNDPRDIDLSWPVEKGVVFRTFDANPTTLYEGVAIGAPSNTPVKAAADGVVIYIGNGGESYGNIILVEHDDPFITVYAHVDDIRVKKGQRVDRGEVIASVGETGQVESPRVQFQVRKNRSAVNPERYLPKQKG